MKSSINYQKEVLRSCSQSSMILSFSNLCLDPIADTNVIYAWVYSGHAKQLDIVFHNYHLDIARSQHFLSYATSAKWTRRVGFKWFFIQIPINSRPTTLCLNHEIFLSNPSEPLAFLTIIVHRLPSLYWFLRKETWRSHHSQSYQDYKVCKFKNRRRRKLLQFIIIFSVSSHLSL